MQYSYYANTTSAFKFSYILLLKPQTIQQKFDTSLNFVLPR